MFVGTFDEGGDGVNLFVSPMLWGDSPRIKLRPINGRVWQMSSFFSYCLLSFTANHIDDNYYYFSIVYIITILYPERNSSFFFETIS